MNQVQRKEIIADVAQKLKIPPSWLDQVINFETGGTYDPLIKNPYSSARGLIQVIDSTARSVFSMPSSLALVRKYPDFKSQMYNVVYPYLRQYAPFPSKQSFFMSIFYPKYRSVPPDTIFPQSVRAVNPGIVTVNDYMRKADNIINTDTLHYPKLILALSILAAGAGYLIMKSR